MKASGAWSFARLTIFTAGSDSAAVFSQLGFQSEFAGIEEFAGSDLIVAADGINSVVRETHRAHFQPTAQSGYAKGTASTKK